MSGTENKQKRTIRTRNLIIRGGLVLGFAAIVVSVIANLVIPAMTNTNITVEHGEQALSNVGLSFLVSEESEIPLELKALQSLRQEYGESAVRLTLGGVILSGEGLTSVEERICLTTLWIAEPLLIPEDLPALGEKSAYLADRLNQIPIERKLSYEFDEFCAERGTLKTLVSGNEEVLLGVLPFTRGRSPYYYPFDTRALDLEMWVEAEIEVQDDANKEIVIAPNTNSQYHLPDWQLSLFTEQGTPESRTHPVTSQKLALQRPFASRLLTTTLLASLFIIIILLGFTRQIDAFIQASVAVLLTLLGIQDLLVPLAIAETTIVDQTILAFYILFALAVLARLTIKPIWDHTHLTGLDEPDDDAGE